VALLEPRPFRTIADDDLAAAPVHGEECSDVLLHRDASDIGRDRARQPQKLLVPGSEEIGIDAAPPDREICEAMGGEVGAHRGGAHHATFRGAVKPAQNGIGDFEGHRPSRPQVLRKLGVIRGGESHAAGDAKAPRTQPQRPFGGDVQSLRRELQNAPFDLSIRQQRQADFRVRGTGHAVKIRRRDQPHLVAETAQPRGGLRQCTHHAVRLRKPRVGHDHDSHRSTMASPDDETMKARGDSLAATTSQRPALAVAALNTGAPTPMADAAVSSGGNESPMCRRRPCHRAATKVPCAAVGRVIGM